MSSNIFVGCVLNPKTLKPCFVWSRERDVTILDDQWHIAGTGNFSDTDDSDQYKRSEASGFPRVHTAAGLGPSCIRASA